MLYLIWWVISCVDLSDRLSRFEQLIIDDTFLVPSYTEHYFQTMNISLYFLIYSYFTRQEIPLYQNNNVFVYNL